MKARVLIVEDEQKMVEVLKDNLEYEGYQVEVANDGKEGLTKFFQKIPDIVVLDILLPKQDGLEVCQCLRARGITVPILFLTAKGSEVDRVVGLEVGGDDYLCKPFFMKEFLARIKALLRRNKTLATQSIIKIGNNVVDTNRCCVITSKNKEIPLSHYEINILKLLWNEQNCPVSREKILDTIWGLEAYPTNRTVDNYIVKLRRALEQNPSAPRHIITVHGTGYKLIP